MELIRKIQQAEAQAQEIIEQAKKEIAKWAQQNRDNQIKAQEEAEQERKKTIEAAIAQAQLQAQKEIETLKAQAQSQQQQIRKIAETKMPQVIAKVVNHITG